MKKIILPLCLFVSTVAYSQHEADNWYFGNNAAITFSTVPPSFVPGSVMQTFEGCASVSDTNGNLLFYSNGLTVWARNHTIMPNGTGLNGGLSCTQSALAIRDPGNDSLYYIFTPPDQFTSSGSFCYSIINMTLNNGYGDVTNKNTLLFNPSTEKVTAVRHANGTDIWVIGHSFNNADFYAYLVTPAGINTTPVISSIGSVHGGTVLNTIGVMKASPCGDKIAAVMFSSFVELFDFDNSTGILSNAIHLGDYALNNTWGLYGTEFSPGGSKLYVTQENPALLVQYDLLAGSPAAIIASADSLVYLPSSYFGTLQNGPDGKMYIPRFNTFTIDFLSCIMNPDSPGAACNFIDTAVIMSSGNVSHGLPNFLASDFCNLNTGIHHQAFTHDGISIFPNPANDLITIHYNSSSFQQTSITFFNIYGQKLKTILNERQPAGGNEMKIDLRDVHPGIYFVKMSVDGREEVRKIVIE